MFHCPVGFGVIEQHAIILSATVRSPTVIYGIKFNSSFVAVVIFIPHKLHLLPATAVCKYCTLCDQMLDDANCHEAQMKTRFVFFCIVTWTLHSACFHQQSRDTNWHVHGQIKAIKKSPLTIYRWQYVHLCYNKDLITPTTHSPQSYDWICKRHFD